MSDSTRALTPNQWIDSLILDLRAQNMSGAEIGDAVALVRSHCEDSGEHPSEAFGTPSEYAQALLADQPGSRVWSLKDFLSDVWAAGVGLVGMFLTPRAVEGLIRHADVALAWSAVAAVPLILAAAALLYRALPALISRGRWPLIAIGAAVPLVAVALHLGLRETAITVPVWVVALLAGVCLAASVVGLWKAAEDRVTDPRTGGEIDDDSRRSTLENAFARLTPWIFVLGGALLGSQEWVSTRL